MGRYYFHIREDGKLNADERGKELPDLDAALFEARQMAKDFLVEDMLGGQKVRRTIEITDADGRLLETVESIEVRAP